MDSKTYQWPVKGSDVPRLGNKVPVIEMGEVVPVEHCEFYLMQPLYGGTCVWVFEGDLQEYIGGRGT